MISPNKTPSSLVEQGPNAAGRGSLAPSEVLGEHPDGGEAPLILIEEHLTDIPFEPDRRSPIVAGKLLANWSIPADYVPRCDGSLDFVLKVQRFAAGGSECTIRPLDLERIGNAIDSSGAIRGKREKPEEQSVECVEKAAQRAKRKVRQLVKNMGATHLVTFTRREGPATKGHLKTGQKWEWSEEQWQEWESTGKAEWESKNGVFWTEEEWLLAWERFRRGMVRVLGDFPYVAILERHKKGNFHLHVAWVGRVNLNVVRPLWWGCCGGRGCGNVQAQYIRVRQGLLRADSIARYISKYVTKAFETSSRFNKKRYWSSRQTMEEAKRYVLKARTLQDAMVECQQLVGFDPMKYFDMGNKTMRGMFVFPDGSGMWFNFMPDIHGADPPF